MDDDRLGEVVGEGRYRLDAVLGGGGMGVVYKARDLRDGGDVALKMLHPEFARDERCLARFRREAELSSAMAHPHVVRVLGFVAGDGEAPFLVMELLDGESLDARIERDGALDPAFAVRVGREVAAALENAHSIGVIHRDLKPANIVLVDMNGRASAKVVDFGLARLMEGRGYQKLTGTGQIVGTPAYMAPEQFRSGSMDERTDIYALGTLLYEALAGVAPFDGPNMVPRILAGECPRVDDRAPNVSPHLAEIVARAMAPDPSDRYGSTHELATDLGRISSEPLPTLLDWQPALPLETLREQATRSFDDADASVMPAAPVTPSQVSARPRYGIFALVGLAAGIAGATAVAAALLLAHPEPSPPSSQTGTVPAVVPVPIADPVTDARDAAPDGSATRDAGASAVPRRPRPVQHSTGAMTGAAAPPTPARVRVFITGIEGDPAVVEAGIRSVFARRRAEIEQCLAEVSLPPRPFEARVDLTVGPNGRSPGFSGDFPGGSDACLNQLWAERYEVRPTATSYSNVEISFRIEDAEL